MNIIIHPTYFPNIAHIVAMLDADAIWFEMEDNFQKQTYRNRTYIYGANGKLLLNIPVVHTQKNRQKYRDVKIANTEKWQDLHWKSLESAYRTSPFFEFYEDEFKPLFLMQTETLLDFNLKCFETICDCLQLDFNISNTNIYEKNSLHKKDYRFLAEARKEKPFVFDTYKQVFDTRYGFIPNLSILDLLFNEGPASIQYLESQKLSL